MTAIAATLVGVSLTACTSTAPTPAQSSTEPATPATNATATTAVALPSLPAGVSAMTGLNGTLWLAAPGSPTNNGQPLVGQLLGINPATGDVAQRIPIGGQPTALTATDTTLWVANGVLDPQTPVADSNTVWQLDTATGQPRDRYQITNPLALTAVSDQAAWVLAADPTGANPTLTLLHNGQTANVQQLTGTSVGLPGPTMLTHCADSIVLTLTTATGGTGIIQQRNATTGTLTHQWSLPASGPTNVACGPDNRIWAAVSSAVDGGLFALPDTGAARLVPGSPITDSALQATPNTLWIITQTSANQPGNAIGYNPTGNPQQTRSIRLPSGTIGTATTINGHLQTIVGTSLVTI